MPFPQQTDPASILQENFSGSFFASIADELVAKYGTEVLKGVNKTLNTWRSYWDRRGNLDREQGKYTFSGDPLRFWWLAKLHLVLYFYRNCIRENSEFDITTSRGSGISGGICDVSRNQAKTLKWWLQLRPEKNLDMRMRRSHTSLLPCLMSQVEEVA